MFSNTFILQNHRNLLLKHFFVNNRFFELDTSSDCSYIDKAALINDIYFTRSANFLRVNWINPLDMDRPIEFVTAYLRVLAPYVKDTKRMHVGSSRELHSGLLLVLIGLLRFDKSLSEEVIFFKVVFPSVARLGAGDSQVISAASWSLCSDERSHPKRSAESFQARKSHRSSCLERHSLRVVVRVWLEACLSAT